jgi:hypothetical protein
MISGRLFKKAYFWSLLILNVPFPVVIVQLMHTITSRKETSFHNEYNSALLEFE